MNKARAIIEQAATDYQLYWHKPASFQALHRALFRDHRWADPESGYAALHDYMAARSLAETRDLVAIIRHAVTVRRAKHRVATQEWARGTIRDSEAARKRYAEVRDRGVALIAAGTPSTAKG